MIAARIGRFLRPGAMGAGFIGDPPVEQRDLVVRGTSRCRMMKHSSR
jgi:hypothetical protein